MASQQDDSRFAHLLQPIRDLAANWDIDVAKELEEYLVRLLAAQSHIRPTTTSDPGKAAHTLASQETWHRKPWRTSPSPSTGAPL